jgi:hypothetical protein
MAARDAGFAAERNSRLSAAASAHERHGIMTRLRINIEARAWKEATAERQEQARRSRLAALLRDLAVSIRAGAHGRANRTAGPRRHFQT